MFSLRELSALRSLCLLLAPIAFLMNVSAQELKVTELSLESRDVPDRIESDRQFWIEFTDRLLQSDGDFSGIFHLSCWMGMILRKLRG